MASIIAIIFCLTKEEYPVVIKLISIYPVTGSTAAYWVATQISQIDSATSIASTVSDKRIFAKASEMRIIDSNYLGVAVIVLREAPSLLMSL